MNLLTQEAKKSQAVVKYSVKNGKSKASRKYGVSLSSVKRWCKRYDGTWQSLVEKSHRPHSNPNRHTPKEERQIKTRLKSIILDTDGTEYMMIYSEKAIQEAFREWYMQQNDLD